MAQSQVTRGSRDPSRHPLLPVAAALAALDYAPPARLWDATQRMARAPELVLDLLDYVQAGKPAADYAAGTPRALFRALPGGHSVATLMRDLELEPVGAFLLGAELVADTEAAQAIITKRIQEGYWKTLPDASRAFVVLAIAEQYPSCPNCSLRWMRPYPLCPRCGYGPVERQIDAGELPERVRRSVQEALQSAVTLANGEAVGESHCPACGAEVPAAAHFCRACGKPITQVAPAAEARACARCGASLSPGARFCARCGARVAASRAEQTTTCPHCKRPLRPGARFCGGCGKALPPAEQ